MIRIALLALAIVPFAIGCSSGDSASTESGATSTNSTTAPGNTQTAAMGKCEQCGKEVALTALHDHGGKKLCADCDGH